MKKFNPEKELSKIRNGNKKKVIISICALLLVGVIGYSFALYQVRHTQKLVFNTVAEFKKRDIILSVLVDGETKLDFPGKDDGYVFDNIICDKPGIEASFNNDTWKLTLTTGTTNKCTVKFITKPYMDESGANYPDLFQGLIPIRFDEQNKMYIANYKEKWYDYNNNEWANAVLIDHTNSDVMKKFYTDGELNVGTEITTDDILQMYVWIPRYKYELWNVNNEGKPKQLINIKFENTIETTGEVSCSYTNMKNGTIQEDCKNAENGNWYTHPAFTFGDAQLRGIWVGKFEASDAKDSLGKNFNIIGEITILPNKTSMISKNVETIFTNIRYIEEKTSNKYNLKPEQIDTHLIKNIEWGAVAYLTQSVYGIYKDENTCNISEMTKENCEVWINNTAQGKGTSGFSSTYGGTATGCVGTSVSDKVYWNPGEDNFPAICPEGRKWNQEGVKASTTSNVYGIYDMSGGAFEYVMGVTMEKDSDTPYYGQYSGFNDENMPDKKYYDLYTYSDSTNSHEYGHLGDSTRETLKTFGNEYGGWNADFSMYPSPSNYWFFRGGSWVSSASSGVFSFSLVNGATSRDTSFRVVLTAQDNS